ncbi:MAG TPA: hypothetical protein VIE88_04150 [Vicinamibacteria bacterium]
MQPHARISGMKGGAPLLLLLLAGCITYEYEEEVFLEIDGSGEIRMSGSKEAVAALHGIDQATIESAKELFEGEGVQILSALETMRERRKFVHVRARFSDWEKLCRLPAFRDRGCRLAKETDALALELSLPSPRTAVPESLDPQALLALRYHFPSSIRYHDSPGDVERGNILSWKRTVREHFAGRPLDLHVRFDRRTILAATVRILGLALGLVLASIGTGLVVMLRKGRRQIRTESISGCPSPPDRPGGG